MRRHVVLQRRAQGSGRDRLPGRRLQRRSADGKELANLLFDALPRVRRTSAKQGTLQPQSGEEQEQGAAGAGDGNAREGSRHGSTIVTINRPVSLRSSVKPVLKRGCLVAAANWPVTLVQSTADSLFKLLIAIPLVGGVFLVALAVGAEPISLFTLTWRELAATIIGSLVSHPAMLLMFLLSLTTVGIGGSLFVFLIKGGTIGVLVAGDAAAGAIEQPPLHFDTVARASRFSIELFTDRAQKLFPAYARLGFALMLVYLASGLLYLVAVFATRASWAVTALLTIGFVAWITIVNVVYLLVQIIIAADDCGVRAAARRTAAFVRHERYIVGGVFLVILAMVIVATGASVLAAASLNVIMFVPFVGPALGLASLPLQLLAWMLREIVFEYIGLASVVAYLKLYRDFAARLEPARANVGAHSLVTNSQ